MTFKYGTNISVVIPTIRNRDSLLQRAIESVKAQIQPPKEIIVVDNGPSQRPLVDPAIRYLRTTSGAGPSQARNMGATVAQGEYVAFLDDDDYWDPNYLKEADALIRAKAPLVIYAQSHRLRSNGTTKITVPIPLEQARQSMRWHFTCGGSATITNRDFFLGFGGFDAQLFNHEDLDFYLRLLKAGIAYACAPKMISMVDDTTGRERITAASNIFESSLRLYVKHESDLNLKDRIICYRNYLKDRLKAKGGLPIRVELWILTKLSRFLDRVTSPTSPK